MAELTESWEIDDPPLGQTIPDDPYSEDGYCLWCGNGSWKFHMPECIWADARDELAGG